ncbi:MAG: glycosyltransferase [Bacteroidia bacterium]
MWIFLQIIFWFSGFAIAYSYFFYPLLLTISAKGKIFYPPDFQAENAPTLAVLMAAYNEESVIAQKIHAIFHTQYPLAKLEVWVGNDASNDKTAEIITELQRLYPQLYLVNFGGRTGKPQIINQLVEKTQAEILVLTDANIIFEPETLPFLIRHFQTPNMGFVAANIKSRNLQASGISTQEDAYVQREIRIKHQQMLISQLLIAPFGACYALPKALYTPVPAQFNVDDFYISMHILAKGYHAVQELAACGWEDISNQIAEEFRRKVRISKGNFQNLATFRTWAFRPFHRLGFHFISHKVLRWATPFLMLNILLYNALLCYYSSFYQVIFALQICVYLLPFLDSLLKRVNIHSLFLRFVTYFINMNIALLQGFGLYLKGVNTNIWEPTKRNQ